MKRRDIFKITIYYYALNIELIKKTIIEYSFFKPAFNFFLGRSHIKMWSGYPLKFRCAAQAAPHRLRS